MCFKVGAVAGTTLWEQGDNLPVRMWGYLVGAVEVVGVRSETQGIEVR